MTEKETNNIDLIAKTEHDFFKRLKVRGKNGLSNLGNTCYVNSTLQCLGHCPSFLTHILCQKWKKDDKNLFHDEFYLIYKALWVNDKSVIPARYIKSLNIYLTAWETGEQSDMHEFLLQCLDNLNREISVKLSIKDKLISDSTYNKLTNRANETWFNMVGNEYSPLISMFYGQIINQIICKKCKKIYHNYEPFSALMLPIPKIENNDNLRLSTCIKDYFKEENLNINGNNWKCDCCQTYEPCLKTLKFWRLPKILIVCIKRFDMFGQNKNNSVVKFPQTLDVSEFMIGPEIKKYELMGVANHYGALFGGHYTAYCKNPDNMWVNYDDLTIRKISSTKQVITKNAYVLFYQEIEK
jgi:ubiquitin C-terminal hydrolase